MKQFIHEFLIRGFIYGSPIYAILLFLGNSLFEITNPLFMGIYSIMLLLWLVQALYFFGNIIFSKNVRESIMTKFMKIQERDEREELIVGKAMRSSFLLMLGLCMVMFFWTTTRFGSTPNPQGGYYGEWTVGHLNLKAESLKKVTKVDEKNNYEYSYELIDFPLSKTGMMLVIILVQIASFQFFSRKYSKQS